LFADICGSSRMFVETGDQTAMRLVVQTLDEMSNVVRGHGGTVVRSKGDDVLSTFSDPDAAVRAAEAMLRGQRFGPVEIRVAINFGPTIDARDDLFGDAVNVAARLLSIARPGEVLLSDRLHQELSSLAQGRLTLFDRKIVKGRDDPLEIYSLLVDDDDKTELRTRQFSVADVIAPEPWQVALRHGEQLISIIEGEGPVSLGRSTRCDLVVPDASVSREHAVIAVVSGRATLSDTSTLGTWIADGTNEILVRRETVYLMGAGWLVLGQRPSDEAPSVVHYEVSRKEQT
jgi:hypothetical protein